MLLLQCCNRVFICSTTFITLLKGFCGHAIESLRCACPLTSGVDFYGITHICSRRVLLLTTFKI